MASNALKRPQMPVSKLKSKSFVRNFLVKFWIVHVRLFDTLEKYEVENLILPLEAKEKVKIKKKEKKKRRRH